MLIIDRTQRIWAALSLGICALAGGVYVVYSANALNGPSGGSVPGLIFGSIAAGMMIFAGLLAARRRFPSARLGSAQFWLRGHLWIGTLTVPFALFHAGFGWGGRLEWLLWLLFFAVIVSGFWGLGLQQILPRMMLEQIPRETFIEQVPHLCVRFTAESDRLLADICGPLKVDLRASDLQLYQPHFVPHFEEDRKKNRQDYPKSISEAEQFQLFLAKIYAKASGGLPPPVDSTVRPSISANDIAVSPAVNSPAQVTAPAADLPPSEVSESAPPVSAKPNPQAMLAAMKAKKEAAAVAAATAAAPAVTTPPEVASSAVPPDPPVTASKPDPQAMLAAMKAKKAAAAGTSSEAISAANPLAAVKPVKEPTEPRPALTAATKIAPPSAAQLGELQQFYLELIRPQLPLCSPSQRWMESMRRATLACRIRQSSVHPQFIEVYERLHDVCEQRRQFAFVMRYHRWLHGWLLIHIPATVALYVILAVHVVAALRVIPFGN